MDVDEESNEMLPFQELIILKTKEYYNASFDEKEKLADKLCFVPEVSKHYLNEIISHYKITINSLKSSKGMLFFYQKFNLHQFSLSKNDNTDFYKYFLSKTGKDLKSKIHLKYLTNNNPMLNFSDLVNIYMRLDANNDGQNEIKDKVEIIDNYINERLHIYNIEFNNITYFPPNKNYTNYSYNYYTRVLLTILIKFRKKRKLFFINNNNSTQDYLCSFTLNERYYSYIEIRKLFEYFQNIIKNFNENNHEKNIKIIKIMLVYLYFLEISRKFSTINDCVDIVTNAIDSLPITDKILEKFQIFNKKTNQQLTKEDWDSIGFDDKVIIKIDKANKFECKIKHFNNKILELNQHLAINRLQQRKIEFLNMEGLLKNNFIQFETEIENYLKNLLMHIFSSKIYLNNFLKFDLRYKNYHEKKVKLMENIFNGKFKTEIFEELYHNVLFIPFPKEIEIAGLTNRDHYTININSSYYSGNIVNPLIIVPHIHSCLNDLYHEISHNLFLLLAANLDTLDYDTINYTDINNELINLQIKYKKEYNIEYKEIDVFSDFGDLMEISLYGIKPYKFKTYSSLFFLDKNSFTNTIDDFRHNYLKYYTYTNNIFNKKNVSSNIQEKKNEVLNLFSTEFWKIISKYFPLKDTFKNESVTTSNKARFVNMVNNSEIIIVRGKCLIERKNAPIDINNFMK